MSIAFIHKGRFPQRKISLCGQHVAEEATSSLAHWFYALLFPNDGQFYTGMKNT